MITYVGPNPQNSVDKTYFVGDIKIKTEIIDINSTFLIVKVVLNILAYE